MNLARMSSVVLASTLVVACQSAHAEIAGFGNFSGFSVNVGDASASPTISPGSIRLTGTTPGQSRSVFALTRQNITAFTAQFTFRATGAASAPSFGSCFVLQGRNAGIVAAPSVSGINTRFGYTDFFGSFGPSVAVSMERASLGATSSSTAVYRNASAGFDSQSTTPVGLFSGNPIRATIIYDGTLLSTRFQDTVTLGVFESSTSIDIPATLGSSTAFVGFTAASMNASGTEQFISDFSFTSVPTPGAAALLGMAGVLIQRRRR
jgi:uncharacterized protein (TIGR03382 family)